MSDRNCNTCIWHDGQCVAWECNYINRDEAANLYKAEVVKVKCKDCRYAEKESETEYWCNEWGVSLVGGDGFCSWGEKKEERTEPESLLEAMAKFRAEEKEQSDEKTDANGE